VTPTDEGWEALKLAVEDALELPIEARAAHFDALFRDAARRAEATRLLNACERAAGSPIFELPAPGFAAPVVAEVDRREPELEKLRSALADRYTIGRELGRGGMATVYLARDERHGRSVALKLLRPELVPEVSPLGGAARFQREIEFAARLSHPHILPLYDSGATGGLLYYITPYVDGDTLRDRLRSGGRPPLDESLRLLRDVARALAHAHRQGVVHRDIKPSNILLSGEGDALVADFGVAKGLAAAQNPPGESEVDLTDGALVLGTPAYMAPEQVTGDPRIDHRADLYALGAVAYELLAGTPPFAGRPRHEQLAAHVSETPDPVATRRPDIPRGLADLVDRLLAKSPENRPRDADEVLRLLDAAVVHPESFSESVATSDRVRRPVPRPLRHVAVFIGLTVLWSSTPMTGSRSARTDPGASAGSPTENPATLAVAGPGLGALPGRARADGPSESGTTDREAYELFLRGRHLLNTRQRDGLFRSLEYFEAAIARDSAFARAHAGIADAWAFLGMFGHAPPHEAFPRARAAAERAIAIDSLLVEAHATLAHLLFVYEWNWPAAEAALERAIAIDPRYPLLRMYYASFLHSVGRPDEALAQLAAAKELEPLTPIGLLSGRIHVDAGRPEEAIPVLREAIEIDPRLDLAHQLLAHAHLRMGRGAEAIASMRRAAELSGARDSAQLAYVLAATGDTAEARRVLERVFEGGGPLDLLGFHFAMAYAGLGAADEAFRWLEAAYAQHASFMNLLGVSTGFESLRPDPRFDDMLRRMGLR